MYISYLKLFQVSSINLNNLQVYFEVTSNRLYYLVGVIKLSFGKRLKDARTAKKLTQVEVADKIGIDDTTISKYENDKSEPDNETLTNLLNLYGVNFDYIHGRELKEAPIEETEKQKKIRTLHELADGYNTDEELDAAIIVLKSIKK